MITPEWNADDRQGSLQQWIDELNQEARRQFLAAGTHVELFFVFGNDGLMEIVPIVGMDKEDIVHELKRMLSERDGYAFIHIVEATARHMDTADEAEMLLVHAESRDGLSVAYCSAVVMQGEKKMLLDTAQVDGARLGGRFADIFKTLEENNR